MKMDVREKLVELLQDQNNPVWRWFPNNMAMMQLADYLIESAVDLPESTFATVITQKQTKSSLADFLTSATVNTARKMMSFTCARAGTRLSRIGTTTTA